MRKLSIKLELSDHYTNHCIRATCMQTLDNAGFEARHIIALSSHKSESTIKQYATKCPEQKKCQMSDTLHNKLNKKQCIEPKEELPSNFDLLEFNPDDDELLEKFLNANQHILDNTIAPEPEETPVVPSGSSIQVPVPAPPQGTRTPHAMQMGLQQNIQQMYPVVPKMYFPGSHITINYNFGTGPK